MKRFKGTKGTILLLVLVFLVVGYYFYLSNRPTGNEEEQAVATMTLSQVALQRDLETNYPPTPKEVVKYFCEITRCFYNEEHTDEELEALADKAREIYDDELVAHQTRDEYLDLLKKDIEDYKMNQRTISSYSPSASVDVEYFTKNGFECARLYCVYDVKQNGMLYKSNSCFILRKDEQSHWKIFGWKMIEEGNKTDENVSSEAE